MERRYGFFPGILQKLHTILQRDRVSIAEICGAGRNEPRKRPVGDAFDRPAVDGGDVQPIAINPQMDPKGSPLISCCRKYTIPVRRSSRHLGERLLA
jgi:hypothetical protein